MQKQQPCQQAKVVLYSTLFVFGFQYHSKESDYRKAQAFCVFAFNISFEMLLCEKCAKENATNLINLTTAKHHTFQKHRMWSLYELRWNPLMETKHIFLFINKE